jgi:hypothetical protein
MAISYNLQKANCCYHKDLAAMDLCYARCESRGNRHFLALTAWMGHNQRDSITDYWSSKKKTPCSHMLSLCSSLSIRDQVSHPYKTTDKISFCILQFLSYKTADKKMKGSELNGGPVAWGLGVELITPYC